MSGQQQHAAAAQSEELFTLAVDIVTSRLPRSGPVQVNYASKLTLYALYKQAVEGNVRSSRPSFLDMLGRAKWDAWKEKKGLSRQDAELAYAETLAKILHSFRDEPLAQSLYQELQDKAGDHLGERSFLHLLLMIRIIRAHALLQRQAQKKATLRKKKKMMKARRLALSEKLCEIILNWQQRPLLPWSARQDATGPRNSSSNRLFRIHPQVQVHRTMCLL